jgi:hypothetical protein
MNVPQLERRRFSRYVLWLSGTILSCGQAPPPPATMPPSASIASPGIEHDGGLELSARGAETGTDPWHGLPPVSSGVTSEPRGANAAEGGVAIEGELSPQPNPEASGETSGAELADSPCPAGMILIDTSYCPRIERRCLDEEYSPQNHFTICHKFAPTQRCLVAEEHRRFCIDEYEYPNQKGAHPPWMVSWYDAQASCAALGKRTCYESEWVSACEGPDKTPFPYGYERDNSKCNIDNTWIPPHLAELYGKDGAARDKELSRLDQSSPSGALEQCVSGFGVHDLTGNFDEWVTADRRYDDRSEWAALKGGAWGHVRNACRPTTTTHPPDFTYYFIGFRCCRDAADSNPYEPKLTPPSVEPKDRAPIPTPVDAPGPSPTKAAREHFPKPIARR